MNDDIDIEVLINADYSGRVHRLLDEGYSVRTLARVVGASPTTLRRIRDGYSEPPISVAVKILQRNQY